MSYFQSIVLGLVQGTTEFLPISSTAHLIIIPWLLGWADPGLVHNVALHVGTLMGVLIYFRKDIFEIASEFLGGCLSGSFADRPNGRLGIYLIIGTIPGVVAGFLLESVAAEVFRHPLIIAGAVAVFGIALWAADKISHKTKTIDQMNILDCIILGTMQALAIIPGVSRSGITITGGLMRNFKREDAAKFSFLLGAPLMAGAGILESRHMGTSGVINPQFFLGLISAAVCSFLSIKYMIRYVQSRSYAVFSIYRLALAAVIVWFFYSRA